MKQYLGMVLILSAFPVGALVAFYQTDEVARERISALDQRVTINATSITEIIRGQQAIQSKMDQGLGALAILGLLTAGQLALTWKRGK